MTRARDDLLADLAEAADAAGASTLRDTSRAVVTATGPLPDLALAVLVASAGHCSTQIAGQWTPLSPRRPGDDGMVTADFNCLRVAAGARPRPDRRPRTREA